MLWLRTRGCLIESSPVIILKIKLFLHLLAWALIVQQHSLDGSRGKSCERGRFHLSGCCWLCGGSAFWRCHPVWAGGVQWISLMFLWLAGGAFDHHLCSLCNTCETVQEDTLKTAMIETLEKIYLTVLRKHFFINALGFVVHMRSSGMWLSIRHSHQTKRNCSPPPLLWLSVETDIMYTHILGQ